MTAFRLYFAQHGLAVDKTVDHERPLSVTGIQQTEMIAKVLQNSAVPFSCVFHSGKLRALQTAEIFAKTINMPSISAVDGLSPNDDVIWLAQNLTVNQALYVGHLPHLEKLVSYLLTGSKDQDIIKFQNSAILCLEKSKDQYHIHWYLTPDLIT